MSLAFESVSGCLGARRQTSAIPVGVGSLRNQSMNLVRPPQPISERAVRANHRFRGHRAMAAVYTVTVFEVNVHDCVFVCLFVSVLLPVCEYLSEMESDQCFISCLFTERTRVYFRLCLPVSEIKSDQCFMLCLFTWRYYIDVNVYDCVFVCLFQFCCLFANICLCLKWNLISVCFRLCLRVSEIKSDQCFILCLFTTSVCFRLCLPVSEIKSDQCFILLLFTGRCYIRQVSDFVCVCVCLKSNQITVLYCCFSQAGAVLDKCLISSVCVCLKSNQINVLCCAFLQGVTILDKGLFSSVPECVLNQIRSIFYIAFSRRGGGGRGQCYIGQVSVFVCVCVCPKSNQINVLYCVLSEGGTILDKCLRFRLCLHVVFLVTNK